MAVSFDTTISVGNIITIAVLLLGAVGTVAMWWFSYKRYRERNDEFRASQIEINDRLTNGLAETRKLVDDRIDGVMNLIRHSATSQNELHSKLEKDFLEFQVKVANHYAGNGELRTMEGNLVARIDKLVDRLDRFADQVISSLPSVSRPRRKT